MPARPESPTDDKSNNALQDSTAEQNRRCFQMIIHTLTKKPEFATPLHSELIKLLKVASEAPAAADGAEWESVSTIGRLDDTWLSEFCCDLSGLTPAQVASLKAADDKAMHQLASFALQLLVSVALPPALKLKSLCRTVFVRRHTDVGKRFAQLTGTWLNTDGSFNWR